MFITDCLVPVIGGQPAQVLGSLLTDRATERPPNSDCTSSSGSRDRHRPHLRDHLPRPRGSGLRVHLRLDQDARSCWCSPRSPCGIESGWHVHPGRGGGIHPRRDGANDDPGAASSHPARRPSRAPGGVAPRRSRRADADPADAACRCPCAGSPKLEPQADRLFAYANVRSNGTSLHIRLAHMF
jgi:hypothetical protein